MAEQRWRISVDRNVCQSTAMCVSVAERFFELRGGYSTPIEPEVDPDEDVVEAAESCPLEAIKVHSVTDGHQIAPEPY